MNQNMLSGALSREGKMEVTAPSLPAHSHLQTNGFYSNCLTLTSPSTLGLRKYSGALTLMMIPIFDQAILAPNVNMQP